MQLNIDVRFEYIFLGEPGDVFKEKYTGTANKIGFQIVKFKRVKPDSFFVFANSEGKDSQGSFENLSDALQRVDEITWKAYNPNATR